MKKTVLIAMLLTTTNAYCDEKQEIAKCAANQSDAERLICYDKLARSLGVDKPKTTTQGKGDWSVRVDQSPIDDSKNVYQGLAGSGLD